jgi:hypothetical protein
MPAFKPSKTPYSSWLYMGNFKIILIMLLIFIYENNISYFLK